MKIDFYTNEITAMKYPPIPAKKMIPDWYKELNEFAFDPIYKDNAKYQILNKFTSSIGTIKSCIPVRDYMTSGYIIRACGQSLITPDVMNDEEKTFWARSGGSQKIEQHGYHQCPVKMNNYKNVYMKFPNPWRIIVPKGYSCLFYQPKFFFEERYTLFPGIVDCDDYQDEGINFPGVVNSSESFYIEPGDPIMLVFPFKRESWEANVRFITEEEWKKPPETKRLLYAGYLKMFHKKKSYK
jgi:hypothetical protein